MTRLGTKGLWAVTMSLVVAGVAFGHGSLVTQRGTPSILDTRLRKLLDAHIPTADAHSTLLVLTECYGGDKLDDFAGRAGTTVISATSPGELATYGGYDDDAANALKPGVGRTSETVHAAGVADARATPMRQGPVASLAPTDPGGPIRSRHVLVYAGRPGGGGQDVSQRDIIKANFEGDATVKTVGGPGGGGWDHPGTLTGLTDALKAIGAQMNNYEQFIMFVTDHGNLDRVDPSPDCAGNTCNSDSLILGDSLYDQMLSDENNDPAVTLFTSGPTDPGTVSVSITHEGSLGFVSFTSIDLNDDGDLLDDGDGWEARVLVDESQLDPTGGEIVTVTGGAGLTINEIVLESGAIAKLHSSEIPVLSPQGLMALGLLLVGAMYVSTRRSSRTARA